MLYGNATLEKLDDAGLWPLSTALQLLSLQAVLMRLWRFKGCHSAGDCGLYDDRNWSLQDIAECLEKELRGICLVCVAKAN